MDQSAFCKNAYRLELLAFFGGFLGGLFCFGHEGSFRFRVVQNKLAQRAK